MKLRLRVVMPNEIKVDEDVDMAILRCTTGDLGVLPRHEALSAVLNIGALRFFDGGVERRMAVYGGLASVQNNVLTIVTNDAEWPEEIDRARADANREHAQRRLQEKTDDIEIREDLVMLRRALVQIEVSSYPFDERRKTEDTGPYDVTVR